MKFDKLNDTVPYVVGGKKHVLSMSPYMGITLALPGRHAEDTDPKGGDFVVMVDDEVLGWTKHQFTHGDLFSDVESKRATSLPSTAILMKDYLRIVQGADPDKFEWHRDALPGLHPKTFLYAVQCLAVAEHRRYERFEARLGGRFLPFRFAAGIAQGLWSAADAVAFQRQGRPGVERLEKEYGRPDSTEMMFAYA